MFSLKAQVSWYLRIRMFEDNVKLYIVKTVIVIFSFHGWPKVWLATKADQPVLSIYQTLIVSMRLCQWLRHNRCHGALSHKKIGVILNFHQPSQIYPCGYSWRLDATVINQQKKNYRCVYNDIYFSTVCINGSW